MLTEDSFIKAAATLGIEVATIKSVTRVESRGNGFLSTGEPVILFERHWMYKLLKAKIGSEPAITSVCDPKAGGYIGGIAEHRRLEEAVKLDRECALQSASWGLFQIMGFHWKTLRYASLQAFINAQYKSEDAQLDTFVRFINANPKIKQALVNKDWTLFAKLYNGPNYAKNKYDIKLREAYSLYARG